MNKLTLGDVAESELSFDRKNKDNKYKLKIYLYEITLNEIKYK